MRAETRSTRTWAHSRTVSESVESSIAGVISTSESTTTCAWLMSPLRSPCERTPMQRIPAAHAARRILDRDAQRRNHVERLCCAEIDGGVRLPSDLVIGGADGVDQLADAETIDDRGDEFAAR